MLRWGCLLAGHDPAVSQVSGGQPGALLQVSAAAAVQYTLTVFQVSSPSLSGQSFA